jgi:hypothetical protein
VTFTLQQMFLLFVVVWSSFATFGLGGIAVVGLVGLLGALTTHNHGEDAERSACVNTLKQIGLALHNYHDRYGSFPPAYVADAQGKPMHSWRVVVLPFLDEDALYQKYRFDEPWDGPNNRTLASSAPTCYRCWSRELAEPGSPQVTPYVAVTGPGTAWPGAKATRFKDCRDGASHTIMLVETAGADIAWSEPRDVTLEEVLSEAGAIRRVPSSHHCVGRTYFFFNTYPVAGHVLAMDGSCGCAARQPSRAELAPLLSIDGGDSLKPTTDSGWRGNTLLERLDWSRVIGFAMLMVSAVLLVSRRGGCRAPPTGSDGPDKIVEDPAK